MSVTSKHEYCLRTRKVAIKLLHRFFLFCVNEMTKNTVIFATYRFLMRIIPHEI